ncbi:DUF742 domain-containing protein [Planomonospora corallina]|uniref:DUF742 domain-containing protein n=1 Tax=Planomonospora corallina TaxID=1806052 RepID=A0ABV8I3I6_9ACTN
MTERWLDQDAGPIVRPYTVTRGRTRPTGAGFDLIATVVAVRPPAENLSPEHRRVLAACRHPISVAELASETELAVGVIGVLLGDLRDAGLVTVRTSPGSVVKESLLRDVLAGLRAL